MKGDEGWVFVVAIHRGEYIEFFMKRIAVIVESEKC